jgi:hypothetical protein
MTRPSRPTPAPTSDPASPATSPALPRWAVTIVLLGVALTTAGGLIALVHPTLLLSPGEQMTQAAGVYADYLVARNLALAALLAALLAMRARRMLAGLLVLAALTQLLDAVLDGATGRWALLPGLLVLTTLFLISAARLSGQAFWKATAWRDTPTPPGDQDLHPMRR